MRDKSQSGSIHLIVVIILVVALVSTLGFVFWQNYMKPKTADSKSATTTSSTGSSDSDKAVDNTKYFSISQWSIKGVYDGQYGLQYQFKTSVGSPAYEYIALLTPDVSSACLGRVLNTIYKYSATDIISVFGHLAIDNPKTAEYFYSSNYFGDKMRKVGDSYYLLNQGVTDACNATGTDQAIETQVISGISRFFLTLQEQ